MAGRKALTGATRPPERECVPAGGVLERQAVDVERVFTLGCVQRRLGVVRRGFRDRRGGVGEARDRARDLRIELGQLR